jgi:hypothetical protein
MPIASERETSPNAPTGRFPKMTSGSSMVLLLTATRGGEEGAPAAGLDEEVGPFVAATLSDIAATAPPTVDEITFGTASGAGDPSLGTISSIATVTVSVGSTSYLQWMRSPSALPWGLGTHPWVPSRPLPQSPCPLVAPPQELGHGQCALSLRASPGAVTIGGILGFVGPGSSPNSEPTRSRCPTRGRSTR